jgi:hypothetical protein
MGCGCIACLRQCTSRLIALPQKPGAQPRVALTSASRSTPSTMSLCIRLACIRQIVHCQSAQCMCLMCITTHVSLAQHFLHCLAAAHIHATNGALCCAGVNVYSTPSQCARSAQIYTKTDISKTKRSCQWLYSACISSAQHCLNG